MIHTYIPFAPKDKKLNLGWVYNNFMNLVNDDDWVLFLDHDAYFTTKNWYGQIEDIIEVNPEYGVFSCVSNRVGNPVQRVNGVDTNNHDIRYHRSIGQQIQDNNNTKVINFPNQILSGILILISKKTWIEIGGFKEGFLGVDNTLHRDCINNNINVGLMSGFYIYHWYRADGDTKHLDESNRIYENPYFKK